MCRFGRAFAWVLSHKDVVFIILGEINLDFRSAQRLGLSVNGQLHRSFLLCVVEVLNGSIHVQFKSSFLLHEKPVLFEE